MHFDLHVHTSYSDGLMSVPELLSFVAQHTHLDGIAITDHDTIAGAQEAALLADWFGVEVIVGEEISSRQGHILGLFLEERIPPGLSARETIAAIKAQGGVAIAAHPLSPLHSLGWQEVRRLQEDLSGLEVFNPTWGGRLHYGRLLRFQDRELKLGVTGGSDAHLLHHVGRAWTSFPGRTARDLIPALEQHLTQGLGSFLPTLDQLYYLALASWRKLAVPAWHPHLSPAREA
ncbi:MAG: PHP-associated domain-containing protein [Bacillota bacterium]|nr:PHP-associated domain-containing protein [Bacillota bacterium]